MHNVFYSTIMLNCQRAITAATYWLYSELNMPHPLEHTSGGGTCIIKQSRSLKGHHRLYTVISKLGNPYIISWRYKYMNKKRENTNIWKINYENKMSMFWPIITETGWVNINNGKYHFNNNTYTLILRYCKFLDKLIDQGLTITRKLYKPGRASGIWNILALLQPVLALPENPNNH